ncbi:MAG: hypothetical protein HY712_03915 [candidate division NC10 bacterium]|nr:hypothetical protein [candidate division NC10 bacterium]
MNSPKDKESDWYFPPDLAAVLAPMLAGVIFLYLFCGISWARSFGDTSLLRLALILGGVGVVLLFFARLPLYRQRRLFTLGPRALSGVHRKLYYAAYVFIIPSVLLLGILVLFVR